MEKYKREEAVFSSVSKSAIAVSRKGYDVLRKYWEA